MSKSSEVRQAGYIPFVGTCSNCGEKRVVPYPRTKEFEKESAGVWNRHDCGQINWLEKE